MCDLLTHLEDFARLGSEVVEDLAANGVTYAEALFTPSAHASVRRRLDLAARGRARRPRGGGRAHGTIVRVAPDVVRDYGLEAAERTLEVAPKFADRGVAGLNCAGGEQTAIAPFARLFRVAKEGSVGAARGRVGRPRERLADARAPPAGPYPTRSARDRGPAPRRPALADGIPLEISPISNIATGVYASLDEHPFLRLRDALVTVTLNSDPPMFDARLTRDARPSLIPTSGYPAAPPNGR